MIPSDFRDYFINSSTATQQEIVSSLLSLSLQGSAFKDDKQDKAITCPHCTSKRIRANGKRLSIRQKKVLLKCTHCLIMTDTYQHM